MVVSPDPSAIHLDRNKRLGHHSWLVVVITLWMAGCASPDDVPSDVPLPAETSVSLAPSVAPTTTRPTAEQEVAQRCTVAASVSDERIDVPGSLLSLRSGAGGPSPLQTDLRRFLCIARLDQGDTGPLQGYVHVEVEEFDAAYAAAGRGPAGRGRQLITQGVRAVTHPGEIWLTPNLSRPGPSLAETVFHEYAHTAQLHLSGKPLSFSPSWLVEGSGLFLGFTAANRFGFDSFESFRRAQVALAKRTQAVLSSFEGSVQGAQGYALGFLAAEYLASRHGHGAIARVYWTASASASTWRGAFTTVFGMSVDDFYDQFEAYRLTL